MNDSEGKSTRKAMGGLVLLVVVISVLLFAPAGTLGFVEGWMFLVLFTGSSLAITLHLAKHDPALLERRTRAGPIAEERTSQKIIQSLASLLFIASIVVPALDHRFRWSRAPYIAVIVGDVLVATGFFIVFLVFRQNSFTSATIEVVTEQRVIETGPYAVVRHPMYSGALVLLAGIPLALGSLVGLLALPPFVAILVSRLLDEERFLVDHLPGYRAYCVKTRYRLVPRVW